MTSKREDRRQSHAPFVCYLNAETCHWRMCIDIDTVLGRLLRAERKAIGEEIRTVQFGWPLGMPLVRKLDVDLWEVRVRLMARKKTRNPHVGSDFESFLAEDGQLEATTAVAIKRVIAWQIAAAMKDANVSQAELARRMKTSRAVIHRLLDADDPSVTLSTISRAATALGKSVRVQLAGT